MTSEQIEKTLCQNVNKNSTTQVTKKTHLHDRYFDSWQIILEYLHKQQLEKVKLRLTLENKGEREMNQQARIQDGFELLVNLTCKTNTDQQQLRRE